MNHLSISGILISITSIFSGLFVLLKAPRKSTSIMWALFSFSVAFWGFGLFRGFITNSESIALFWGRFLNVSAIFIPIFFFHFVLCFTNRIEEKRKELYSYYVVLASYFLLAIIFQGAFVSHVAPIFSFKYYPKPGLLYYGFGLIYSYLVVYGIFILFKELRSSSGIRKNQIKYLLFGVAIGFSGGATTFFPVFGIKIYPIGTYLVPVYVLTVAYAILKYHLLDINIALTRAGIFLVVYALVLGIPFWLGYTTKSWFSATTLTVVLATLGPLIYNYLRRQAESRLRAEEFHARELLTQASEGMMRFRSIKKLTSLIVHVTCKTLKLDNAGMFLLDEEKEEYKLEAVRLKSKYQYLGSLDNNDALIQRLSTIDEPIVYEEVKMQSQELKDKPDEPIHDIESQMQALSAAVVIPATSRGRLLGFLVLAEKKTKRMYSQDDLSVLWALSYQAALAIENARFHQKAQEELLREDREVTSRFIGHGASHQFGNLLHRIIQRSEGKQMDIEELDLNSLSQEDLKKLILELKGEFSAITKTAFQGKDIVSGILSLGSGSPVEFKEEDLRAIITTAVSTIKLKQSKKTIQDMASVTEIVTHITDNLPKIYCNNMQLEQVLDNLLDNDLEAIEEKENFIKRGELKENNFRGRITLEAELRDDHFYLKIQDNGIGIKPEDQKKVFMPFFTTKATERLSRKGHGIGMHMVKEIIKAHQGKIYIDKTEYTKGTTFVMELPLKVSENKKV